MSADHTSPSSDKRRRVPALDPEDYCMCLGDDVSSLRYVGFSEWELFEKDELVLDSTVYASLLSSSAASRKYEKQIDGEKLKWKLNTDKIRQA